MSEKMERDVIPGVDVGTYDVLKDMTIGSFPYAGGMVVLEVYTKARGTIPETPVSATIEAIRRIRELPKETKPEWVSIVFGGWDDDKRPVPAIPECRSWCRKFVTDAGPEILSILMYEPQAIEQGGEFVADAGFGIVKLLVTAGYGAVQIREDCDASVNASEKACNQSLQDENGVAPITYELSYEGCELVEATLRHKWRS